MSNEYTKCPKCDGMALVERSYRLGYPYPGQLSVIYEVSCESCGDTAYSQPTEPVHE